VLGNIFSLQKTIGCFNLRSAPVEVGILHRAILLKNLA
jgi:hypothetical protein